MSDEAVTPATETAEAPPEKNFPRETRNLSEREAVALMLQDDGTAPPADEVHNADGTTTVNKPAEATQPQPRERDEQGRFKKTDADDQAETQSEALEDEPADELTQLLVGGDEGVSDQDAGSGDDEAVYSVKVNGEDVTVTLSELQRGYSREADYTRKTQDLAEQRRVFEAERDHLQAALQQQQQQIQAYVAMAGVVGPEPQPPDPDGEDVDEFEYAKAFARYQREKKQWDQTVGEYQRSVQEAKAADLQRQTEAISKAWPEFVDPEKGPKIWRGVEDFLRKEGFSNAEIANFTDARSIGIVRKAMMQELGLGSNGAKRRIAQAKAVDKPRLIRPGPARDPGADQAEEVAAIRRQAAQRRRGQGLTDDEATYILSRNRGG